METILNTSSSIWEITEGQDVYFEPIEVQNEKSLLLEIIQDDEDGTFPSVRSYVNLIKKMDFDGASAFLDWYGAKKLKFDNGYANIIRESKFSNKITLTFKEPIKMIFGYVGDEPVVKEIKSIKGNVTWEAFWMGGKRRQNEYCNGIEVYLQIEKCF